jgi:cytochrome c peroxidase
MKKLLLTLSCAVFNLTAYSAVPLTPEQQLGEALFKDKNLSFNHNQSCETCHSLSPIPSLKGVQGIVPGFVDPSNVKGISPISVGSIPRTTGTLNAPSIAYASYSPEFGWDEDEQIYVGGQFWNGRATNLIEQAKKPFLNPVEMAMLDELDVVNRIKSNPKYIRDFQKIYQLNISDTSSDKAIQDTYTALAKAISAFEQSGTFNKFNSKFDYYLAGTTQLSAIEKNGLDLFQGKAGCSGCHKMDVTVDSNGNNIPPLFTYFGYDNIGLPRNMAIPGNPVADLGLGGREGLPQTEIGKHKVKSLRNIDLTPPYGHNGIFKTLDDIVHFYNTRDVLKKVKDNNSPEFAKTAWAPPEIASNMNTTQIGNLGLSIIEEKAIVAFLKTLTDDYLLWGNNPATVNTKESRVPENSPPPIIATKNMPALKIPVRIK